jgi:AraC family transcriptional regulator
MVCPRCITSVENLLNKQGIQHHNILLGEVEVTAPLSPEQITNLGIELHTLGFELIDNRRTVVIEKIKKAVMEYIDIQADNRPNLSVHIAEKLNYEYTYLSDLFSSIEGQTIEQYYIHQRIEKAKELLVYDELSLTEIAFRLGYSSVHHLSAQFKKTTGLTPTYFKKLGAAKRKTLDAV